MDKTPCAPAVDSSDSAQSKDWPRLCAQLGSLCRYPEAGWPKLLRQVEQRLAATVPEAATALLEAGRALGALTEGERKEFYIRVFDMVPKTSLDIGWHLFGESYERGSFLVRLGKRQRELGLENGGELADHLPNVLALVARLEGEDAGYLVHGCVLPAMVQVLSALKKGESPYEALIRAVCIALRAHVALPASYRAASAGSAEPEGTAEAASTTIDAPATDARTPNVQEVIAPC